MRNSNFDFKALSKKLKKKLSAPQNNSIPIVINGHAIQKEFYKFTSFSIQYMNRFILFLFFISSQFVVGQDGIGVYIPEDSITDYSSGHSPLLIESTVISELSVNFSIVNTTGADQNYRVIRWKEANVPSSWTDAVCFGINCFSPSTNNPWCSSAVPINALTIANNSSTSLYFHATPDSYAVANYKLYIGTDCSNFINSISIQITYLTNGLDELMTKQGSTIYPNPAADFVSITYNHPSAGILKIMDVLGNVIDTETIQSSTSINTSNFNNGTYFFRLEDENGIRSIDRIVVSHY